MSEVDGICSSQLGKNLKKTSHQKFMTQDSNPGTFRSPECKENSYFPCADGSMKEGHVVLRPQRLRFLLQQDHNAGGDFGMCVAAFFFSVPKDAPFRDHENSSEGHVRPM